MQYHHRDGSNPSHPAGDSRKLPLRVDFDRRLKLEFLGSKITSDAGLLAYRELDDVLGLTDLAGAALSDLRRGKNTRHLLTGLLRQSVFGRLAGYEDVNDAERLSRDPAMRAIVARKGLDRRAASTSQMGRFETEWLATDDNLAALTALSGFWIDRVHDRRPPKMIALDMDSSVSPTHGEQEGTAYNGHFGCACYHPLFVFNQFGDLERCALRPGNVHSADGWREVLEPVVSRYRDRKLRRYFRADAAFASPEVYEFLEAEASCTRSAFPPTGCCNRASAHLLRRPVGRPPKEVRRYHAQLQLQGTELEQVPSGGRPVGVASWRAVSPCRVHRHQPLPACRAGDRLLQSARHGGAVHQGRQERCFPALASATTSVFKLHVAYNLGNFLRTLALPDGVGHWSLTTLREKLSRLERRSCATAVTSLSRWRKWRSREACSEKSAD